MKFEKFQKIRESLKEAGTINESVVSFREYKNAFASAALENMAEEIINSHVDENDIDLLGIACYEDTVLDEASNDDGKLKTMFKNIFGLLKIKSLGGTYMKAMADEALADMDYERKKEAAGGRASDPKIKDKLNTAHKAKKDALSDRAEAIGERIDNIATTDYLKKVSKKTKLEARIKKNQILLKIANAEESKTLKIKNAELGKEVQETDAAIGEYQKENKDDIEKAKEEMPKKIKEDIKVLNDKISEVQGKIEAAEESLPGKYESLVVDEAGETETAEKTPSQEAEEAKKVKKAEADKKKLKVYTEIIPLKTEKAELVTKRAEQKDAYNQIKGKDEYSVEDDQKEVDALKTEISKLGAKIEKLQTAGVKGDEKTTADDAEETTADDAEKTPAAKEPAKEPVDKEQKAKETAVKKQQLEDKITSAEKKIEELKEKDPEKAKKIKASVDELYAKLDKLNKEPKESEYMSSLLEIEQEIDKILAEFDEPKKNSRSQKSTMTFEEFRTSKTK